MALLGFGGRGRAQDEFEDEDREEEPVEVEPGEGEAADGDPEALLRAAPFVPYRLHEGHEALYVGGPEPPRVVAAFFAEMLAQCRTFADLDEHLDRLALQFGLGRTETTPLRASLEDAAESGLLVSLESVYRRAVERSTGSGGPAAISTMGLVTRDRVEQLARGLRSWMECARAHERHMDFVVCDDSPGPEQRSRCAAEAEGLGRELGFDVWYAGAEEKEAYAAALAAELAPDVAGADALARFCLLGAGDGLPAIGANRNTLALHCAGEAYAASDDDVTCRLARAPDGDADLALTSRDPTSFRFYGSVQDAISDARFEDVDPWAEHGRLLGRSLDDVVAGQPGALALDLDEMGDELFRTLLSGRGTVRVTSTGLVGDSGMGKASYLLLLEGDSLDRLLDDPDAYDSARSTRAVFRAAPRLTVSDSGHLMASAVAVDARALLPPFMPVLRNEDGIFVETLRVCTPGALVGHLPWAARHEPPRARAFADDEVVESVSAFRAAEYVVRWTAQRSLGAGERDPEARLASLGRHFRTLGALPPGDLEDLMMDAQWRHLSDVAMVLERRLEAEELPEAMAEDVERCLEHIVGHVGAERSPAPVDLADGRTPAEAVALFGRLLADYGRLLEVWPLVLDATRSLRERGVRPARRLG